MKTLRQRQKKWLGHVLCHDPLLKKVIEGQMKGIKKTWKAKGNVTRLVDEIRIQNAVFTAKEEGRKQN